jgi:hypothetical protein
MLENIYVVEQSSWYKVNPQDGSYEVFDASWGDVKGIV